MLQRRNLGVEIEIAYALRVKNGVVRFTNVIGRDESFFSKKNNTMTSSMMLTPKFKQFP